MIADALLNTAHDIAVGLALAIIAFAFLYLLVRSNEGLKRREQERCRVTEEEVVRAFQWPPRPKPAVAETHPRAHEAVVPSAGRRAA